jgi:hypothetical protein
MRWPLSEHGASSGMPARARRWLLAFHIALSACR